MEGWGSGEGLEAGEQAKKITEKVLLSACPEWVVWKEDFTLLTITINARKLFPV